MSSKFHYAEPGDRPPPNAKRIYRWADLPGFTGPAQYLVEDDVGGPRTLILSNHKRQVLEGLLAGPIYAASYCRISDQILPLRRDHGLDIVCTLYRNDPETGREKYGVYTLISNVRRAEEGEVA